MNKVLQWIIGIGAVIITLAVVFSTVAPYVVPNLGWSGYRMMNGGPAMMNGYGSGMAGMMSMMGGQAGNGRGGMMGAVNGTMPTAMHTALLASLAEKLNLSRADLEARLAAGESLAQIASAQGVDSAGLPTIVAEARQSALAQVVADGSLTQAQADRMAGMMTNQNCPFLDPTAVTP